jgi:thioredoxin-related protein
MLVQIEAEAQSDLAEKYDVETVPFFVFFKVRSCRNERT